MHSVTRARIIPDMPGPQELVKDSQPWETFFGGKVNRSTSPWPRISSKGWILKYRGVGHGSGTGMQQGAPEESPNTDSGTKGPESLAFSSACQATAGVVSLL